MLRDVCCLGQTGTDMQMTGIHMAAREGHLLVLARLSSVQFLDVNGIDTWGYTPLDHAVSARQWPCAVLLLSMGGAHSPSRPVMQEFLLPHAQ